MLDYLLVMVASLLHLLCLGGEHGELVVTDCELLLVLKLLLLVGLELDSILLDVIH